MSDCIVGAVKASSSAGRFAERVVSGRDDYLFEGYELEDALAAANDALEDDASVSEQDGHSEHLRPFARGELLKPLENWFFGRR